MEINEDSIISDIDLTIILSLNELKQINDHLNFGQYSEIINKLLSLNYLEIDSINEVHKQIIICIHIYSLLKLKKYETAKSLINFTNFNIKIFPFVFLSARLNYFNLNDTLKGISEFYEILSRYEDSSNLEHKIKESSEYINTQYLDFPYDKLEKNIKFEIFGFFFDRLFCIGNKEAKIIKCYMEIKNGYIKLGLNLESLKIVNELNEKYDNNILITFEAFKQNLYCGFVNNYKKLYEKLQNLIISQSDSSDNFSIQDNLNIYLLFADYLLSISSFNYSLANEKLSKIMELSSGNTLILNNMGLTNFYLDKIEKSQSDFFRIIDKNEMNLFNEVSYFNYNSIYTAITYSKIK